MRKEILTEEQLREYLITLIENAYNDAIEDIDRTTHDFKISDKPDGLNRYIEVQYCYDEDYNRFFIEFELSNSIKKSLPWDRIVAYIHSYINTDFAKNTKVYPEIIAYEDDVNERYDSVNSLSPFTIGYWDCLHGHYEYLYSHQVFMDHMSGLNIPTWSSEFIKEMDDNFKNNYISNYSKFLKEMTAIREKYNINADQAPEKKLEDFVDMVKKIRNKYTKELTVDQKDAYIKEFMELSGDSEKIKELNKKYEIDKPMWTKIPEIMEEYKKIYKDFFGVELHDFISNTKKFYIIET